MPVGYSIYQERPSVIHHRVDPRTKLAVLITIFILALEFNHPLVLALLTAAVLAVGLWAQLSLKQLLPFLIGASWLLILGALI
jgi:energy-coupling factor transporter transmembrane protein EcfT